MAASIPAVAALLSAEDALVGHGLAALDQRRRDEDDLVRHADAAANDTGVQAVASGMGKKRLPVALTAGSARGWQGCPPRCARRPWP